MAATTASASASASAKDNGTSTTLASKVGLTLQPRHKAAREYLKRLGSDDKDHTIVPNQFQKNTNFVVSALVEKPLENLLSNATHEIDNAAFTLDNVVKAVRSNDSLVVFIHSLADLDNHINGLKTKKGKVSSADDEDEDASKESKPKGKKGKAKKGTASAEENAEIAPAEESKPKGKKGKATKIAAPDEEGESSDSKEYSFTCTGHLKDMIKAQNSTITQIKSEAIQAVQYLIDELHQRIYGGGYLVAQQCNRKTIMKDDVLVAYKIIVGKGVSADSLQHVTAVMEKLNLEDSEAKDETEKKEVQKKPAAAKKRKETGEGVKEKKPASKTKKAAAA